MGNNQNTKSTLRRDDPKKLKELAKQGGDLGGATSSSSPSSPVPNVKKFDNRDQVKDMEFDA